MKFIRFMDPSGRVNSVNPESIVGVGYGRYDEEMHTKIIVGKANPLYFYVNETANEVTDKIDKALNPIPIFIKLKSDDFRGELVLLNPSEIACMERRGGDNKYTRIWTDDDKSFDVLETTEEITEKINEALKSPKAPEPIEEGRTLEV